MILVQEHHHSIQNDYYHTISTINQQFFTILKMQSIPRSAFLKRNHSIFTKNSFIPLFQYSYQSPKTPKHESCQLPKIQFSKDAAQIFRKGGSNLAVVTIFHRTKWCQQYSRKVFLRNFEEQIQTQSPTKSFVSNRNIIDICDKKYSNPEKQCQKQYVQQYSAIQIHTKIQIGHQQAKQPITWVYIEADLSQLQWQDLQEKDNYLLSLLFHVSSYIFYEIPSIKPSDPYHNEIEKSYENFNKIYNLAFYKIKYDSEIIVNPTIILMGSEKPSQFYENFLSKKSFTFEEILTEQQSFLSNTVQNISISKSYSKSMSKTKELRPQAIQKMLKLGKKYINSLTPKRYYNSLVNGTIYIQFINHYLSKIHLIDKLENSTEGIEGYVLWVSIISQQIEKSIEECMNVYENKYQDLVLSKSVISLQVLQQAHKRAKQFALNWLGKQSSHNCISLQELQNKFKVIQKSKKENLSFSTLKWGKQLLNSQYLSIQRKLKLHQINSLNTYKREIAMFRDFFIKKTQNILTNNLSDYFQTFIYEKMFQAFQLILHHEKENAVREIEQYKNKITLVQCQTKEAIRRSGKEEADLIAKMESLQEKNAYLEMREKCLQQTILKLERQLKEGAVYYQVDIQSSKQANKIELQIMKTKNKKLQQAYDQLFKQYTLLSSQIKKQKLLLKNCQNSYEKILSEQKLKEDALSSKLEVMSIQSDINENKKQYSLEFDGQSSILRQSKYTDIRQLKAELNSRKQQIQQLQAQISKKTFEYQLKIQELGKSKNEFQMQCKILEQKLIQNQSKLLKYKKIEQQILQTEKDRQQDIKFRQSKAKEVALLQHKITFMQEKYDEEQQKKTLIIKQNAVLKKQNEEMYQKIRQNARSTSDEWVQVEEFSYKNKLNEAVEIVQQLQKQYDKIKNQLSLYRRMQKKIF